MKRHEYPWDVIDSIVAQAWIPQSELLVRYGPWHREYVYDPETGACDPWDEPGPYVYWCFEFNCGLKVLFSSSESMQLVTIKSNRHDIRHIFSHFAWIESGYPWIEDKGGIINCREYCRDTKVYDIFTGLKRYKIKRMDDLGNEYVFKHGLTDLYAGCLLNRLAETTHKQTYELCPDLDLSPEIIGSTKPAYGNFIPGEVAHDKSPGSEGRGS